MQIDFDKAQEAGDIPMDEMFSPAWIITNSLGAPADKNKLWPYQIGLTHRNELHLMAKMKKVIDPIPSGATGRSPDGVVRGVNFMQIKPDMFVFCTTAIQSQLFPIDWTELLEELLIIETHTAICQYFETEVGLISYEELKLRCEKFEQSYQVGHAWSCGYDLLNPLRR